MSKGILIVLTLACGMAVYMIVHRHIKNAEADRKLKYNKAWYEYQIQTAGRRMIAQDAIRAALTEPVIPLTVSTKPKRQHIKCTGYRCMEHQAIWDKGTEGEHKTA